MIIKAAACKAQTSSNKPYKLLQKRSLYIVTLLRKNTTTTHNYQNHKHQSSNDACGSVGTCYSSYIWPRRAAKPVPPP
eukprot:scaffold482978_cov17-Prasinocladus_malaysianus.AAC.1